MKIKLERVHYMPKELQPGTLYVSEEFGAAAHLCACGCGAKVRTPLTPTEWSLEVTSRGPSLYPSVGNWQQPCRSHYWISEGQVKWAAQWTEKQIAAGRGGEEVRRNLYYNDLLNQGGRIKRAWRWLKGLFKR